MSTALTDYIAAAPEPARAVLAKAGYSVYPFSPALVLGRREEIDTALG